MKRKRRRIMHRDTDPMEMGNERRGTVRNSRGDFESEKESGRTGEDVIDKNQDLRCKEVANI